MTAVVERICRGVFWAASVGGAVLWAVLAVRASGHPYSLDYGEPVVELGVRALLEGGHLYRPIGSSPLTLLPYNPLYPYGAALLSSLDPDRILAAGRTLSVVAALVVCIVVYRLARRIGTAPECAAALALLFLSDPLIARWSMLMKSDLTALALEWAGLALLLGSLDGPAGPRRAGRVGGTILLVGAFLAKQTYILSAPVYALALWRKQGAPSALRWSLVYAGLLAGTVLALEVSTRGAYGQNAYTANLLSYHPQLAFGHAWIYLRHHALPVVLALVALAGSCGSAATRGDRTLSGLVLYLALSAGWGALAGKVGAAENYFLQLTPALYLLSAALLRLPVPRVLVMAAFAAWALLNAAGAGGALEKLSRDMSDQRRDLAPLVEALSRTRGEVLSEDLSILIRAGKSVLYSPFEYTQLARSGRWDEGPFVERIRRGEFELLLFQTNVFAVEESQRYSRRFVAAVRERYRPMGVVAGQIVCVRKVAGEAS